LLRHAALAGVVGLILTAVAGLSPASASPSDTVDARQVAMRPVKLLHWNLAGAARNWGDSDVVDRLVQEAMEVRPDVVTMNEACGNQVKAFRDQMATAGWGMEFGYAKAQTTNLKCGNLGSADLSVGNAVFVRGSVVARQNYSFDQNNKLPANGIGGSDRVIACLSLRFSGTPMDTKVCTTHLAQRDDALPNPFKNAEEQTRELARVFGPEARRFPFILTGDFNIESPPNNAALATLYPAPAGAGDFSEVDQYRGCVPTSPCVPAQGGAPTHTGHGQGPVKLDYLFADRWHFTVPPGKVVVDTNVGWCRGGEDEPCSDHFLVSAEVQLPAA
jgi:endonuclease/exonuclease/phosphatase family metal-dependent hydrolase